MFSGSNFVINILLARWLLPDEYGLFAITYSIFIFISGFHNALILEPLSVLGPSKNKLQEYLYSIFWLNVTISVIFSFILLLISLLLHFFNSVYTYSFLYLAIAMPFLLLIWLLRRICYLATRPITALEGSILYLLINITGLFIINKNNMLTAFNVYIVMGISSLISSIVIIIILKLDFKKSLTNLSIMQIRNVLTEHWGYGRWVMGSALVNWVSRGIYLPLIGSFIGLMQVGVFRALENLILPIHQVLVALGHLLLPWMSRKMIKDRSSLLKILTIFIIGLASLVSFYILFILLLRKEILLLLYGQNDYFYYSWLLPYFAVNIFIAAPYQALDITLKSIKRPDAIFWGQFFASIYTLSFGIYLIIKLQLVGAAMSLCITKGIMVLVLILIVRKSVVVKN